MAKKLSKISQRFSEAAKQARAEQRKAREAQLAQDELSMEQSIVPADFLAPMPAGMKTQVTKVEWKDQTIALVCRNQDACTVLVTLYDVPMTRMEIQNIETCGPLLTFRSVLRAFHFWGAGANLAARVRQRDVQAEAEQIRAATGEPSAVQNQSRL